MLAGGKFAGVLLGLNILNFPYRWDGVEAAAENGCGVVVMNPLAGGAIPSNRGLCCAQHNLRFT
jgi:predicted aldo/keto reductase-like oxidoreductase